MDETLTPEDSKMIKRLIIAAVVLVLGIITLFNTIVVTGSGTVGVITRFSKVDRETQAGLHLKIPYVEGVTGMNIQIQKEQVDAAASTIDLQDVTTTLAVNYNLDPGQVDRIYREVGVEYKTRIIDPAIQEAFKSVSAQYTASELLTKRSEIKTKVVDKLRDRLIIRGILLDDVSIVNFQFSKEFTNAIESKQIAQQQAEQAQYDVQKAENQAKAAIATAAGQAEAQRQLQVSLTPDLLQKYAIDKWDGHLPTTTTGSGTIFSIPLGK